VMNTTEYNRAWRKSNAERIAIHRRNEKVRNREAHRARRAIYKAIRYRGMFRPDHCTKCGLVCKPEAHHKDYSKRFEVVWLCRSCHLAEDIVCRAGCAGPARNGGHEMKRESIFAQIERHERFRIKMQKRHDKHIASGRWRPKTCFQCRIEIGRERRARETEEGR